MEDSGNIRDRLGCARARLFVFIQVWTWSSRQTTTDDPWCARENVPTGVNLNRYSGPSSCIRWHSDNEPLFGPPNQPKLIVSLSIGNSVDFKVRRRVEGKVPSLITLDHGDLLVMDGLTQSEYVHCTASELQGPRVNLTYRWVTQHAASCPLAGEVGCVLPTCVQCLAEPGFRGLGEGENKWTSFGGLVLLLSILVSFLLVSTWIRIWSGIVTVVGVHPAQRCTSPYGIVPVGSGDGVGDCHDVADLHRERLFISLFIFFKGKTMLFFREYGLFSVHAAEYAVSEQEPPLVTMMHFRWVPLSGHFGRNNWQKNRKTTLSPLFRRVFLVNKRTLFFFRELVIWMLHIDRARHPGPGKRSFTPGQLSVEFVNVGGWLTFGDLAMDSCAQFLAVAEHRLISLGWAGHQLGVAGFQSVWAPACRDHVAGGHAGVGVVSLGGARLALPTFCDCWVPGVS